VVLVSSFAQDAQCEVVGRNEKQQTQWQVLVVPSKYFGRSPLTMQRKEQR